MAELILRFLLGGCIVSAFALIGCAFKPSTFSGIFCAAPSVALASLGLAYAKHGGERVAVEGRSMIVGAAAFAIYGLAAAWLVKERRTPAWLEAGALWLVWIAAALGIWAALLPGERVKIAIDTSDLRATKAWELAVRFAFGGAVTVLTGLLDRSFGPVVGGLFLAFPAILPATLTLVTRHEDRDHASRASRGAATGAAGLAAFGAVAWIAAGRWPAPATLLAAAGVWLAASFTVWYVVYGRRA